MVGHVSAERCIHTGGRGSASPFVSCARFADQGEKCREVSLSMTLRFADLLPAAALVVPPIEAGCEQVLVYTRYKIWRMFSR